jgi:hypothetical protein
MHMSYVDLIAMESVYRNDKNAYDYSLNDLNYSSPNKNSKRNVFMAAQMNADLQTSLLSMSNSLSPEAKEQYQLLAASKDLEIQYAQLVGNSKIVNNMEYSRFFAWGLGALVLMFAFFRVSNNSNN